MTTLVIPTTFQVGIEMVCSGQPVWNVLHFDNDAGSTPTAALTAVKNAWEATSGPLKTRSSSLQMVGYHYTDLGSATGAVQFLGSTTAGAVSGGLSTMASSALIKLSSGTRSRSQQGRLYHGPLLETQINTDGRQIDSTYLTTLNTAYGTFRTAMSTANMEWLVASRKLLTTASIASASCAGIIATQRRRLR